MRGLVTRASICVVISFELCSVTNWPFYANAWTILPLHTSNPCPRKVATVRQATQYTIDDSLCPPTRPHILKSAVTKACGSLDTYLSRKPIAPHTQQAFDTLVQMIPDIDTKELVLDSGCGTGRSTILMGEMYPDHVIIGVDRSFTRITKTMQKQPEHDGMSNGNPEDMASSKRPYCQQIYQNTFLVRAELVDFWTCCLQRNLTISHHYILYPNPYPTQTRVTQRFYAHPSFPLILQLQPESIILRSNWEGYLKEFAMAVSIAHDFYASSSTPTSNHALAYLKAAKNGVCRRTDKKVAWTNFEQKYDDVGEETYELILTKDI